MKTARIIATITILALAIFMGGLLPNSLIPDELVNEWPAEALAMFFAMYLGYALVVSIGYTWLFEHIWK